MGENKDTDFVNINLDIPPSQKIDRNTDTTPREHRGFLRRVMSILRPQSPNDRNTRSKIIATGVISAVLGFTGAAGVDTRKSSVPSDPIQNPPGNTTIDNNPPRPRGGLPPIMEPDLPQPYRKAVLPPKK